MIGVLIILIINAVIYYFGLYKSKRVIKKSVNGVKSVGSSVQDDIKESFDNVGDIATPVTPKPPKKNVGNEFNEEDLVIPTSDDSEDVSISDPIDETVDTMVPPKFPPIEYPEHPTKPTEKVKKRRGRKPKAKK